MKTQWMHILQRKLSAKRKSLTLSGEKMQQLVEDYWAANKNNRHKAFPHFYQCVSQALTRYNCNCNGRHCCELRNCWTTPPSLIALLQRHLYIEVEGMADVLHHSNHLKEWYSPYRGDVSFGAKYDFFTQELAGRNTYINPPFNTYQGSQNLIEKVIEKVFDSLRSSQPTRVVLLIPIFEGKQGHLYETQAKKSRFLEIATFPKGSFSFVAPEHYHISNNFRPGFFSEKIGLYLCANKASLQVDPIDWYGLTQDLLHWSQDNTKHSPIFSNLTRQKFEQRITPSHKGRDFNRDDNVTLKPSNNFFHYYDHNFPLENEIKSMKSFVPNPRHLELLAKLNQHNRTAGALGILPNHLLQLLRLTNPENVEKITNELRFAAFWATYNIWTKRQRLNRTYWNIVPETWKHNEELKKDKYLGKKRKRTKQLVLDDCKNPFHYLLLKSGVKPIQGTCDCSRKTSYHKDIRNESKARKNLDTHILPFSLIDNKKRKQKQVRIDSKRNSDYSGLDYKHNPPAWGGIQLGITQFLSPTSADISREEQDRKKRFKQESYTLHVSSCDLR